MENWVSLGRKEVAQIFKSWQSWEKNLGHYGQKAEILPTAPIKLLLCFRLEKLISEQ